MRTEAVHPLSLHRELSLGLLFFCLTSVLFPCSFVLFLGLVFFQEAQWMEGTRAVGLCFSPRTTLQRRHGNPDCM